jgi:hypothetical protein
MLGLTDGTGRTVALFSWGRASCRSAPGLPLARTSVFSSVAGHALVGQERKAIAAGSANAAACQLPPGHTSDVGGAEPDGLFEAPALGLVAPRTT